jgi:hypothetical protein
VRQVVYLLELYRDARSPEYKIGQVRSIRTEHKLRSRGAPHTTCPEVLHEFSQSIEKIPTNNLSKYL